MIDFEHYDFKLTESQTMHDYLHIFNTSMKTLFSFIHYEEIEMYLVVKKKSSREIFNCHNYFSFECRKRASELTWSNLPSKSARLKSCSAFLPCIEYVPLWSANWCNSLFFFFWDRDSIDKCKRKCMTKIRTRQFSQRDVDSFILYK